MLIMVVFPRFPVGLYQDLTYYALVFGPSGLRIRSEAGLRGPILKAPTTELFERGRPTEGLFQPQVVEGFVRQFCFPVVVRDLLIVETIVRRLKNEAQEKR